MMQVEVRWFIELCIDIARSPQADVIIRMRIRIIIICKQAGLITRLRAHRVKGATTLPGPTDASDIRESPTPPCNPIVYPYNIIHSNRTHRHTPTNIYIYRLYRYGIMHNMILCVCVCNTLVTRHVCIVQYVIRMYMRHLLREDV